MATHSGNEPRTSLLLLLGLFCGMAAVSAHGQTQITKCGTEITAPGRYVLANDLDCSGDGIKISHTSDVELKLDGHRMTGPDSAFGIKISAGRNVRVVGPGTLDGFLSGVWIGGSSGVLVTGVTSIAMGEGFLVALSTVQLRGNTASQARRGFWLASGRGSELTGNSSNGNEYGFLLGAAVQDTLLRDNTALNNQSDGIMVSAGATGNHIDSNTAMGNGTGKPDRCCDLDEGNATCRNVWEHNIFQTANLDCIH
jgi:parallel beta-helix repeat protein